MAGTSTFSGKSVSNGGMEARSSSVLSRTSPFQAPVLSGFLGAGDVLHLLADIDAQFIR
jgi:hypothetical protein